jgi:4-carboxymuconolactone decarboxylase
MSSRLDARTRSLVRLSAALTADDAALIAAMDDAAAEAPREAEEVLLQSHLFLGYPVALNSLGLWRRRTGRPPPDPARSGDWQERGERVCRAVYGHQYEALREVMGGIHPDLDRWAVADGYGKVLGRPELDLETRELCVAALLSGIDAGRQLHAHLRGCLNVGATPERVEAVLEEVAPIVGPERARAAERIWERVRERWMSTRER